MLRKSQRSVRASINFFIQHSSSAFATDQTAKSTVFMSPSRTNENSASGFTFETVEKDVMSGFNTENAEKLIKNTLSLFHENLSLSQGLYIGRVFARYPDKVGREPIEKLLSALLNTLSELEPSQYVELVWIVAKLSNKENEKLTNTILSAMEPKISQNSLELTPSCTALIIWGFGKTHAGSASFWQKQVEIFSKSLQQMKTIDIANAAWGLTKAEDYFKIASEKKLWLLLADFLKKRIDSINDLQAFSNILWVFSRKELGHEEFWERAIKQTNKYLENFENQALTNSVWAIAKFCSTHNQELLDKMRWEKIEEIINKKHLEYKESELCSLAWSFSKARSGSKQLWNIFYARLKVLLTSTKVEDLAITTITASMATLSSLKLTEDEMWDRILEILWKKKKDIGKKDLVTVCLALAMRKKGSEGLWGMFEEIVMGLDPKDLEAKFISNIAWCFSLRGLGSQKLWDYIKLLIKENLQTFTPQGISTCFWAFAKCRVQLDPDFIDLLLTHANSQLIKFNSTDLAMLLWSFGRLAVPDLSNNSNVATFLSFAENFLLVNKEKLSDIDTAHSLLGFHKLKGGSAGFWESMETIVKKKLESFNEEGLSVVLNIAVEKFSSSFWTNALNVVKRKLRTSTSQGLKNYISSFGNLPVELILLSTQFWISLEEDLFIKMDTLSPLEISDIGVHIARHQKGTADFWRKFETHFIALSKTFDVKPKQNRYVFLNILNCTLRSNMLTPNLNVVYLPFAQHYVEKTFCTTNDVFVISCSYGRAKISDDRLWFQIEKKVSQMRRKMDLYKLIEVLKYFSFMKKGTERFWIESMAVLHQSQESLSLTQTCQVLGHFNLDVDIAKWGKILVGKLEKEKNVTSFLRALNELANNRKFISVAKSLDLNVLKEVWKNFSAEERANSEKDYKDSIEAIKKLE